MATLYGILAWRSLSGYSPWDRQESDTTEVTEHTCNDELLTPGQVPGLWYFLILIRILNTRAIRYGHKKESYEVTSV